MRLTKTQELIRWLEENQPERQYKISEIKDLLSIIEIELSIINDKSLESLPYSIVKEIIEESTKSGDIYMLNKSIDRFKSIK